MKRLILLSILIISVFQSNAQLKGKFCRGTGYSSTCINFINEKEFEYTFSDCTSDKEGSGTYKLKRKELILTFAQPETKNRDCMVKIKESESSKDSVSFNIFVFDKIYLSPLSFLTTALLSQDGKLISWKSTDLNGVCNFSLPKTDETVFFKVQYVTYEACLIPISLNKDYKIEIGMAAGPVEVIGPRTIWKWKITSLTESDFIIQDQEDKIFKKSK